MVRAIFDFVTDFSEHLSATGSILLAIGFAGVMYLLQRGANHGNTISIGTQRDIERVEYNIEQILRYGDGKIPSHFIEENPFSVFRVCKRMKRNDLITSNLKWRLFKGGAFLLLFLLVYFSIFGLIIFSLMKWLGKFG